MEPEDSLPCSQQPTTGPYPDPDAFSPHTHSHTIFLKSILILSPWSRVFLERLVTPQIVKKFTTFYGTRRFITLFTRACHWSLSWARCIQSTTSHPISL